MGYFTSGMFCTIAFVGDVFLICSQLKYAQDADTRQQAYESYKACLELNAPLLDHAIELRHHIATWLGYKSWADYKTKWRMAKSGDNVEKACSIYCDMVMVLTNTYSFWQTLNKHCIL
jgi:Peptidase family M3